MNDVTKILLFSTDPVLQDQLKKNAVFYHMEIMAFEKKEGGLMRLCEEKVGACIIDSTPLDLYLLHEIRFISNNIPVLLTSSMITVEEKAKAYELGCDYYLQKPVDTKEVFMKLHDMIVRSEMKADTGAIRLPATDVVVVGQSTINFRKKQLATAGRMVKLTQKQADLLELLCLNKGRLITKDIIAKEVWNTDDTVSVSLLVYIHRLRKLFRDDPSIEIQNVHGLGYIFVERRIA